MPLFHYEVINAEGASQEGEMESTNPETLADSLQKRGFVVLNIAPATGGGKSPVPSAASTNLGGFSPKTVAQAPVASGVLKEWWAKANEPRINLQGKVPLATILLFTSQLASMVGAGLHLLKSLRSLAEGTSDKRFKAILENIQNDVEGGESFSNALAKYPKVFGTIYVNLVKAAEATGDLDIILAQLAIYLDKTLTLRRKVKGAMTYPVVILCFALIAVLILIAKIVPSFQQTFAKLGSDLPAITKSLILVSDILRDYLFFLIASVGLFISGFFKIISTPKGRFLFDKYIIKLPIFGDLIWKSILTRFLRTLSVLLDSGVTVLEAFQLAGQAAANKLLEKSAEECIEDIKDGVTIHEAMESRKIFPSMVIRMVSSGEEAGTLPDMLQKTTVYFEQQVETAVESLSSLIEPILIVILGTIVGTIIIAIFLPIFKLGEAVKGAGKRH